MTTVGDAVRTARARLAAAGIPSPEAALDAAGLAMQALACDRASLLTREADVAPPGFVVTLEALVQRRASREPMAYIRGWQEFWGRAFAVSPDVLIPRPETELVIDDALAWRRARPADAPIPRIVDIGTGSGCLAVTLACEWPDVRVDATDISGAALETALANAARHGVEGRVRFHQGSCFADVAGALDLVVANPPYVSAGELAGLQPEVRDHEPRTALDGGPDGLRDVRDVVAGAARRLGPEGLLLLEIGAGQADAVGGLVRGTPGLSLLAFRADLQGIPRLAVISGSE